MKKIIKKFRVLYRLLVAIESSFFAILQRIFLICAYDITTDIEKKPTLVIAPHPDDETLGCGATILRMRKARLPVRIVIVTDGRFSTRSISTSPEELAALRREEALRACAVLGVAQEDVVFLSYADGAANENIDAIASDLLQQIKGLAPKQIFSPYGIDTHPDHQAVAAAVTKLLTTGDITCPVYQYPIWFWNFSAFWMMIGAFLKNVFHHRRILHLKKISSKDFIEQKKLAMTEYCSQNKNLTGEADWQTLPPNFLPKFFLSHELFLSIIP